MEIQLTALIWNKSSFGPWLWGRWAEPTVTLDAWFLAEARDIAQEPPEWGELDVQKTVMGLVPGG